MLLHLLFLLFLTRNASSLNILVFSPAFGWSHTNFMAHVADTLTEAGHSVCLLVPVADEALTNQKGVILTKDVVIVKQDGLFPKHTLVGDADMKTMWEMDSRNPDFEAMLSSFSHVMQESCANFLRNKEILEQMKSRTFDVAIMEPLSVCALGFFKKLGIEKTILSTSTTVFDFILEEIGEPEDFSYVPCMYSQHGDEMSFMERYENYRSAKNAKKAITKMFDKETEIYQKYLGQDIPNWRDLMPNASLFFTNSNPYLDFPRPVLPKTVAIGGLTLDKKRIKSEKLDDQWQKILNKRPYSLLISFGSMAKSFQMPMEFKKTLLKVIRSEPNVTFIWKYENDDTEFARGVDNLIFSKWVPQPALLMDPRLTAFLTHGGLGSTNELVHAGKPAIFVPVTADQTRNANMVTRHGNSIYVLKNDLAKFEVMKEAIHSILYEEKYRRNALLMAEKLENQLYKPKDLLVKHTEFVGRYGPFPQMNPRVTHLNYFSRNLLDVNVYVALPYVLITLAVVILTKLLFSKLFIKK